MPFLHYNSFAYCFLCRLQHIPVFHQQNCTKFNENPKLAVASGEAITTSSDKACATPPGEKAIAKLVSPNRTATSTKVPARDLSLDLKPHATSNAIVQPPTEAVTTVTVATMIAAEPIDIDIDIEDELPEVVVSPGTTVAGFVPTPIPIPPNPRAVTMPGSAKKIWPNRVTALTTPGTMIAFLHLPKDRTKGVHESCLTRIENSEAYPDIKKTFHFFSFPPMVSTTDPEQALSNNRIGGDRDQDRHCILRICHLTTRIDNSMVDKWGTTIAKLVEFFCKGDFSTPYRYVGNMTPPTMCPLSCYIPLAECSNVMVLHERTNCIQMHTNRRPLEELLEIPDLAAKYFLPQHLQRAKALAAEANAAPQQATNGVGLDQFLQNLPDA
jgi:hypothetical protein